VGRPLGSVDDFLRLLGIGSPKSLADAAMWPAHALCSLDRDDLADAVARFVEVAYVTNRDAWLHFSVELAAKCRHMAPFLKESQGAEAGERAISAFKFVQLAVCGASQLLESHARLGGLSSQKYSLDKGGVFRWDMTALWRAVEEDQEQLLSHAPVQRALLRAMFGSLSDTLFPSLLVDRVSLLDVAEETPSSTFRKRAEDGAIFLLSLTIQPLLYSACVLIPPLHEQLRAKINSLKSRDVGRVIYVFDPWWDAPAVRLLLATGSQCALVSLLYGLPPQHSIGESSPIVEVSIAALIVCGSLATEFSELTGGAHSHSPIRALRTYFTDEFNYLDLCGLGCAFLVVVTYPTSSIDVDEYDTGFAIYRTALRSTALLCLCLQPMRLTYLSPIFGPYVMMVWRMLGDVVKLVAITIPIATAFAVALNVTFSDTPKLFGPLDADSWSGSCSTLGDPEAQAELEGDFSAGIGPALVVILEVALGASDARLDCARGSRAGFLAWALVLLCSVVTVVLLLNVIIAAMAKSFNLIHDNLDINARFVRAKLILSAGRLPIVRINEKNY